MSSIMRYLGTVIAGGILVTGLFLFTTCSDTKPALKTEGGDLESSTKLRSHDDRKPLRPSDKPQKREAGSPIRLAVFADQSRSISWTRTPQLTFEDLEELIDLLRSHGGELAFGLIRDQSNRGLIRLRIEIPIAAPPQPPAKGNPFDLEKKRAEYETALASYRKLQLGWQAQTEEKITRFKTDIAPLLAQKADAGRTDIWGAVTRSELFLGESDASWPRPTRRYAVFVSDGQHTARSSAVTVKSGAKIILVNGSNSLGSLGSLQANVFESVSAAFQFMRAADGGQQ